MSSTVRTRWIPHMADKLKSVLNSSLEMNGKRNVALQVSPSVRSVVYKYHSRLEGDVLPLRYTQTNKVFANNHLNLGEIKVVGFDLDYTLVSYTVELQNLIYTMARDALVEVYGYPTELKTKFFDPSFAVRGLSVDARYGVLLKLNHLQRVKQRYAHKGKRKLTIDELHEYYGPSRHISHTDLPKLRPINDLYAMASACLIADCIELFEEKLSKGNEEYCASAVLDDIEAAITDVHTSGGMHGAIMADLDKYVHANDRIVDLFRGLKNSGKKLFLCTNSPYKYAAKTLSYVISNSRVASSRNMYLSGNSTVTNDNINWRDFFDIVICSAQKPHFFSSTKAFRTWNSTLDRASQSPVTKLTNDNVYINGSVAAMQKSLNWQGKDILYIGDNLRADLQEASRLHGWHTACIINELDRELDVQSSETFQQLHYLRGTLRSLLCELQSMMYQDSTMTNRRSIHDIAYETGQIDSTNLTSNNDGDLLLQMVESELHRINTELSSLFNPQFGSIFRTDGHSSLYAYAVRRYADIYMSDVSHLADYSPNHRFYPAHSLHMAHDPVNS